LRFPTFQSSGAKDEMRVSYGRMQGLPAHLQGQTKPGVFLSAPRLWLETATSTIPVSSRGPHDALIPKMPPTWQGGYHPDPFSVIRGRMEREGTRTALGLNHQEERQIGVGEQSVRACVRVSAGRQARVVAKHVCLGARWQGEPTSAVPDVCV
jgi:hypothetical protein